MCVFIILMAMLMGMAVSMNGVGVMCMVGVMRMPMAMIVRMKVEKFLAPDPTDQHPYSYCKD